MYGRTAGFGEFRGRMNNIYGAKLHLVPVGEMVDCLRINPKEVEVKQGMWVRIKRGKYGGDLAQVFYVLVILGSRSSGKWGICYFENDSSPRLLSRQRIQKEERRK